MTPPFRPVWGMGLLPTLHALIPFGEAKTLAAKVGVPAEYLRRIVAGKIALPAELLIPLSVALGGERGERLRAVYLGTSYLAIPAPTPAGAPEGRSVWVELDRRTTRWEDAVDLGLPAEEQRARYLALVGYAARIQQDAEMAGRGSEKRAA